MHHSCSKQYGFPALSAALLAFLALLVGGSLTAGCGGGGGGGSQPTGGNVTLIGVVMSADTGLAVQSATVATSGKTVTTGADGSFTLSGVPATATTATVTASGEQTRTLTLSIPAKTTTLDLGNIFLSATGYTASASGTVVTPKNGTNQPVAGASVTIAGSTVLTAADGTFSIPNLPVGLGNDPTVSIGTVRASGYADKPILTPFPFVTGANPLGTLLIQIGLNTAKPGLPYTITGQVTHSGTAEPGVTVELLANNVVVTTTTTDANGNYYFWVVPGSYSVATFVNNVQSQPVAVTLVSADAPQTANLTY